MEKKYPLGDHFNYVCPECGIMINEIETFWQHLNRRHNYIEKSPSDFKFKVLNKELYECKVCNKRLNIVENNPNVLKVHYFSHLSQIIYNCLHCNYAASRQTEIYHHLQTNHKQFTMTDPVTSKECSDAEFNDEFYLRFQCPECGEILNKYKEWLRHIIECHKTTSTQLGMKQIADKPNYYYCIECKRLLNAKEQSFTLQKHRFTHLPYAQYLHCAFCDVKKSTKSEIYQHFMVAHPNKYAAARPKQPIEWGQKIKKIAKDVKTKNNDILYMEIDIDDSKNSDFSYLADVTNDKFLALESHMQYICPECGVEFEEQLNWRLHINTLHKFDIAANFTRVVEQNAYKCLQCFQLQTTSNEEDLQQHRCIHLPYRAYLKCVYCNSCKSTKTAMLKHMTEYHKREYHEMLKTVKKFPEKINIFPEPLNLDKIKEHLKQARRRIDECMNMNVDV